MFSYRRYLSEKHGREYSNPEELMYNFGYFMPWHYPFLLDPHIRMARSFIQIDYLSMFKDGLIPFERSDPWNISSWD